MLKEEKKQAIRALLSRLMNNPASESPRGDATDEEVRDFIRIFMDPTGKCNKSISSYGLKHAAERTIGAVFRGNGSCYAYVSNDQFKRIINEAEFRFLTWCKKTDGPNEYYSFKWCPIAEDVFYSTSVYGSGCGEPLLKRDNR